MRQLPVSFSSGMIAGLSTSAFASPFELTKLGSQIELVIRKRALEEQLVKEAGKPSAAAIKTQINNIKPLGAIHIVKQLVKKSGWLGMYSGYRYMIVRDILGAGVYFAVYDSVKSAISLALFKSPEPHPVSVAIAGALSGAVCWSAVFPIDTIKSRYQRDVVTYVLSKRTDGNQKTGFNSGSANRKLPDYPQHPKLRLRELFNRNMYRGLSISLIRTCMFGMCMFSCYEKLMKVTA